MPSQSNPNSQLLFKIDIKMGQRIVTLNVKYGDTIQSLLLKHKMSNKANTQKFQQLKQKIKTNIQKQMQIKVYSNQLQLASKMEAFLTKQNQEQDQSSIHKEFKRTQNRLNQKIILSQTPFKLLFEKTLSQFQEKSRQSPLFQQIKIQSQKVTLKNNQTDVNVLQEVSLTTNQQKKFKPKASICMNSKLKTIEHKQSQSHKKAVPHKMDEDLIRAYEVIWKKSKDKTMREMAEKTLKQLNFLPPEDNITNFLHNHVEKQKNDKFAFAGNEQCIKSLTPIEKSEKQPILNDCLVKNEPFSESRSFMRRNYRYSYLQDNKNLNYLYEKSEKQNEKYLYNRLDQTYVNILNKDYDQKGYQKIQTQPQINRRYSYLDD